MYNYKHKLVQNWPVKINQSLLAYGFHYNFSKNELHLIHG